MSYFIQFFVTVVVCIWVCVFLQPAFLVLSSFPGLFQYVFLAWHVKPTFFLKAVQWRLLFEACGIAQQPEDFIPALTNALDCPSVSFSLQKRLSYKTASSMSKWGHQTKMIWIHSESVRPLININKLVPSLECNCFHHIFQQASLFFFKCIKH